MAINFDDIASRGLKAGEEKKEAEERKYRAEQEEKNKIIAAAINALETHITPQLEKAKDAFARRGVASRITKQFDVLNRVVIVWPSIMFQCLAPPRPSDGYVSEAIPVFFEANDRGIRIGAGEHSFDNKMKTELGTVGLESVEPMLEKVLTLAIEKYSEMMDRLPYKV